jgi:hypothetical protein
MSSKKSDVVVDSAINGNGGAGNVLDYLVELERQKHELLLEKGIVDFESLRTRLRSLEVDIAGLSGGFSSQQNGHLKVENGEPQTPLTIEMISDVDVSSSDPSTGNAGRPDTAEELNQSMEFKGELEAEHDHIRRSSLQSTGSGKERHNSLHTRPHRRLSIGSHPLYTMPNAFQYGIKLRDTKMNGMSMFEEAPTTPGDPAASPIPGDKFVQGSRERETNVRSITDKFADSLNGTDRAMQDLRKALNAGEIVTNRTSFSMPPPGSHQKARQTSSEGAPPLHGGTSLAKALLSAADDMDLTMDSIDAPKRHSLMELTEAMDEGDETLRGEDLSEHDSEQSSTPEGAIEFCIVEADWAQLHQQSQRGHLLTPLLPPRRSWRYPMDLVDNSENNTKELQDQSFFFPSGVKVDLVWPSVAALRSKSNKHIRHIVPFTDAQGKPTYACVLTVTQTYDVSEIAQLGDIILPNLVRINRQKQSAMCIQKCFRQYVAYRKMVTWQLRTVPPAPKAVAADSPVLMRSTTIFGRLSNATSTHSGRDARLADGSLHGSAHGSSTHTGTGSGTSEPTTQSRRTWTSFFSARHQPADGLDNSAHGGKHSAAPSPHPASAGPDSGKRPGGGILRSSSGKFRSNIDPPTAILSEQPCFPAFVLIPQ